MDEVEDVSSDTETNDVAPEQEPVDSEEVEETQETEQEEEPEAKPKAKAKPEPKKDEPPKPKKTYKLKVNGKEEELDADEIERAASRLGIHPDDLLRGTQLTRAAYDKMREAAQVRAEAEKLRERIKADPGAVLKELGLDPDQFAEQRLMAKLQAELDPKTGEPLSPEARRAAEAERKLAEYEARQKAEQEKAQQAEIEAETQRQAQEYSRTFAEAVQARGLPATPQTIARMAGLMAEAEEHGVDLSPADAAAFARDQIAEEQKAIFGGMEGEPLLEALGAEMVEKVRSALVAKMKAARKPTPGVVSPSPAPRRERQATGSVRPQDFRAYMREWGG